MPEPAKQRIEITHRGPPLIDQFRNAIVFVVLLVVVIVIFSKACGAH